MKGDFSRQTFNLRKHYQAVLLQQGRVAVDADWNEQQLIYLNRLDTEGVDIIGKCGAPLQHAGFKLLVNKNRLLIRKGRYYVDGLLVQNADDELPPDDDRAEEVAGKEDLGNYILYTEQPHLIKPDDIVEALQKAKTEIGLVYLDVWQRHITFLDDGQIAESALNGPDTATRLQNIWQVKVLPVSIADLKKAKPEILVQLEAEREQAVAGLAKLRSVRGRMTAGRKEEIAKAEKTFQELEDRIREVTQLASGINCNTPFNEWTNLTAVSTGKLTAFTAAPTTTTNLCLVPPSAGFQRLENQLYRVEIHKAGSLGTATFKWSRDNGTVVSKIERLNGSQVTVHDLGPDSVLGFAVGQWVEVSDDHLELNGLPGTLAQIQDIDINARIVTLSTTPVSVSLDFNPKLRRWDMPANIDASNGILIANTKLDLEDGVQVQFAAGNYHTGDYWLIPARTGTGRVEWPPYDPELPPLALPPLGIAHHYCRLGLVQVVNEGLQVIDDCRNIFPPLTRLTNCYYVSGDGQEGQPGQNLPQPLQVGVINGSIPVANALVQFQIIAGGGTLHTASGSNSTVVVPTGTDGVAECQWQLDDKNESQRVEAKLIDNNFPDDHLPIRFNSTLARGTFEKGIHIVRVRTATASSQRVINDIDLPVDLFSNGIFIDCDTDIFQDSVRGKPVCYVTLDLPFPFTPQEQEFWGSPVIGYQTLTLAATTNADNTLILWKPTDDTKTWLVQVLFRQLERFKRGTRILARLTLKGNFVWASKDPELYVDGEAFGFFEGDNRNTDIRLPSGDSRKGGDFEMWFWLVNAA